MKQEKITIEDIARQAGVSPATVSRVLNHRELVKADTAKQVENAMAALGYAFESTASPSIEEQPLIVLNIPGIENVFYQEVIKGARVSAKAHGCHLLINESPLDRGSIRTFCNLLHRVNAAGSILLNRASEEQLKQIRAITPLVQCCEYNEDASGYPYVSIDDFSAAETATGYLCNCGCNKIALINGPLSFKYAVQRQEGYLSALKKAEISVPQNWIIQLPEINYQMAYAAICRLLNSEPRPNAFFVASDIFAAAVIRAAKRFKLNVPRDIMVVGFDNIEFSTMTCPSITTVNQPRLQLGYTACEMLLEMMENPSSSPKSLILDAELVIRESTAKI